MKKEKNKRNAVIKMFSLGFSMTILLGCIIGGTIAWLTAQTTEVTNTFSASSIGVELEESDDLDLKMIPGWTITKDPKAWVTEGSEAAYLFVKVEKSAKFDTFMTYEIGDGWTELESAANTDSTTGATYKVYYREVTTTQMGEDNAFYILKDNKITVKNTVTEEMMATGFTAPTLTFTAYAHQLYQNEKLDKFEVATAWTQASAENAGK